MVSIPNDFATPALQRKKQGGVDATLSADPKNDVEADLKKPPYSGKDLGNDPTKSPGKDFDWRGKGEVGSSEGSWFNPGKKESLHPDLSHPPPIKPHWDYRGPNGEEARLNIDGTWEWK